MVFTLTKTRCFCALGLQKLYFQHFSPYKTQVLEGLIGEGETSQKGVGKHLGGDRGARDLVGAISSDTSGQPQILGWEGGELDASLAESPRLLKPLFL